MKKILFVFSVFCFLIPFRNLSAQSVTDTIEIAKQLRNEKNFKDAFVLLEKYRANHPDNLNASWISAQTAYWMRNLKTSETIYEQTMQYHPENYYLKFDFAKMLFNIGEFEKAIPLLNNYLQYDTANTEALLALAKISYWKSNYNEALNKIEKILFNDPKNKKALLLQEEILSAKSPWCQIGISQSSDDQPLKNTTPIFEGGLYMSALSFLSFNFQIPTFVTENNTTNAWWFRASNKSVLSKQSISINVDVGLLKYPVSKNVTVTGNLQLDKTIIKHLIFSVEAERKPYFYTLSSLENVVTDNQYSVSAAWNESDKWNLKTALTCDYFNDKNSISTFSAWCITPPLKINIYEFHLGYSFNYGTSKENRFVADKTLSEILADFYNNPVITGIYQPYFTPNKQRIHSVIASMTIHPLKTLDLSVKGSYGFSAVTQCPYLYLDKDASGTLYISKNYCKGKYAPLDISIYATWQLTKKTSLKANYIFDKTNFYKSNYMNLGLKMNFWDEKR